ncbi:MAG: energy transducer TonB [Deltaproteobacteria bacterium]|nr:energy transducer TonB [Deltaproteobacteria bacterium]
MLAVVPNVLEDNNLIWRALGLALACHLMAVSFMLWPQGIEPSWRPLAVMSLTYDPLGGEPGPPLPEAEPVPPEPAPAEPEESEPEETPALVESLGKEAEEISAPPLEKPPKKTPKPKVKKAPPPKTEAIEGAGGSGSSGPGQGGYGGGTGQGTSDALLAYKSKIRKKLENYKKYPTIARRNRLEGIATVAFTVNREGQVTLARLTKSSGHPILDDEAEGLLRRVNPLPPFPKELEAKTLSLTVPISFSFK